MDCAYLLVIDNSPDQAQIINSFLRNSGMAVRIVSSTNYNELEEILKNRSPFLALIGSQLPPSLKIENVLQLADQYSTPVVMQVIPGDTKNLQSALSDHPVLAINAKENKQLMRIVRQHLSGGKSSHDYDVLQHKLRELQDRYDLLLDSARDSIAYIHEGLHVYANRAYLNLLQVRSVSEIEGFSLLEMVVEEEVPSLKKLLRDLNQGKFPENATHFRVLTPGGQELQADFKFAPARYDDENCIQLIVSAQNAQLMLDDELASLRKIDQLTKMVNRTTFIDKLSAFITQKPSDDRKSAILYIEPDGISELQQDLDLECIDAYILDLANVIRDCMEEGDLPARFSDFGFLIWITREKESELSDTGKRIISSYANHIIDLGEQTMSASCSVGLTTLGSLTDDTKEVINQARKAFKKASYSGNTLIRYKPTLTTVSAGSTNRDWVERIRFALNNHDLYTIQQSIVDLDGENEGLFDNRTFMREDQDDTHASEFLPIAEQHDLGSAIDRYVIPRLLSAIAGTGDRHIISLSSNSVLDFSFPNWFQHKLKESETEASQLILQISAITAESNLIPTRRLVGELQAIGCGILLSDFDNQRRTMQLLDHLPISMVKLRSGLAVGLSSNTQNQEIIRAVINGTESRHVQIIANEVQDASDLAVLWQCGIKLVAGDFLNEAPQVVGQ